MSSLLPDEPDAESSTFEWSAAAVLADRELTAARATLHASNDPLTGVRSRHHWEVVLTTEGERFRRYATPFAVVIVDLEGLEEINERPGGCRRRRVGCFDRRHSSCVRAAQ